MMLLLHDNDVIDDNDCNNDVTNGVNDDNNDVTDEL